MELKLKNRVVAYLDILGFKELLKNKQDFEQLLTVIKNIKQQDTRDYSEKITTKENITTITSMPLITSFSDCIVLSVPLRSLGAGGATNCLLQFIQQLSDSLIFGGYILRGGIAQGMVHHHDGTIFGEAYIEAYELESNKAINPRILISKELAVNYDKSMHGECNFLSKENYGNDEYYLDYLKLSFTIPDTKDRYLNKTKEKIKSIKQKISEKIQTNNLNNIEKDIKVLQKWVYFEKYINSHKS